MRPITNLQCILAHENVGSSNVVSAEKICTVDRNVANSGGVCGGDSGGPLIWNNQVVGVACWTVRPCGSHPSVYVRTSHHMNWILQHV